MLIIAVFVNEMIEELWLTSGYWGFTLDPPMDMEARLATVNCCANLAIPSIVKNILKDIK